MTTTKIYLAARYTRREELCAYRAELEQAGFTVTSRWLNGDHQIDAATLSANDPDGMLALEAWDAAVVAHHGPISNPDRLHGFCAHYEPRGNCTATYGARPGPATTAAALRTRFAQEDWDDLLAADIVVSFTEEPRGTNSRGGRHVEFGAGLALGKRAHVVGPRENVFHCLPDVTIHDTWTSALAAIRDEAEVAA